MYYSIPPKKIVALGFISKEKPGLLKVVLSLADDLQ